MDLNAHKPTGACVFKKKIWVSKINNFPGTNPRTPAWLYLACDPGPMRRVNSAPSLRTVAPPSTNSWLRAWLKVGYEI